MEVTLDTEVAFWYAPNPAMHSIQPESLSMSPFHGSVGASRTPEEPQFYYMPVCLFPGAFNNNKYLEFNVNLLVCLVLGVVPSVQKCLFTPNLCLFSAAFVQTELCVTTLIQRGSRRGGREFHKALNSIKLAKFNPSTWLNIILEMLW